MSSYVQRRLAAKRALPRAPKSIGLVLDMDDTGLIEDLVPMLANDVRAMLDTARATRTRYFVVAGNPLAEQRNLIMLVMDDTHLVPAVQAAHARVDALVGALGGQSLWVISNSIEATVTPILRDLEREALAAAPAEGGIQ